MVARSIAATRSQAESYIKIGKVKVGSNFITKPSFLVVKEDNIRLISDNQYVSRAGFKLESVALKLKLDFKNKIVLDVGSSTGGFTDYAIQNGASKIIAVDVGTRQMHPSLVSNSRVELHENTDIRNFENSNKNIDIVVIDVSFISLKDILPFVAKLVNSNAQIIAMVKPQFEAVNSNFKHKGVIKNDRIRREIFKDFETWAKNYFVIKDKYDSAIAGSKGNLERFYLLYKLS